MKTPTRLAIAIAWGLASLFVFAGSAIAAPPSNDDIAQATTIAPNSSQNGTNVEATLEPAEPLGFFPTLGKSVWYVWTAADDGEFVFDTCGSAIDTVTQAWVYDGDIDDYELFAPNAHADGGGCSLGDILPRFDVSAGTTVYFQIASYNNGAGGAITANLAFYPRPANDNFVDSVTIEDGQSIAGDSTSATVEVGESTLPWTPYRTVWYTFEATDNGEVTFDTCTASYDTYVVAFTGSSVDALTPIAWIDQGCPSSSGSKISQLRMRAGDVVHFRVQSSSAAYYGTFTAALQFDEASANDDFEAATALALTDNEGSAAFNNAYASNQAGEPLFNPSLDRTLWYSYTPTLSGHAVFEACDTVGDTGLAVYTGTSLGTLSQVTSIDQGCSSGSGSKTVPTAVSAGTTYWIQLSGFGATALTATLSVSFEPVPANDNWASARDLGNSANVAITDDNRYATNELSEPTIYGSVRPASVWYKWTAPASGSAVFGSCGVANGGHDAVLAVFTGSSIETLTQEAQADSGCSGGASGMGRLTLSVTAGTAYWIAVANWSVPYGVDFGVEVGLAPVNSSLPTISGTNRFVGTQLTASDGSWAGADPITYTYQWRRCDTDGANCADIALATGSTYTLVAADKGNTVRVQVTGTNSVGNAAASSLQTVVIDDDVDGDTIGDTDDDCDFVQTGTVKSNGCIPEGIEMTTASTIDGDRSQDSATGLSVDAGVAANDPGDDPTVGVPTVDQVSWFRCSSPIDTSPSSCDSRSSNLSGNAYSVPEDDLGGYVRARVTWVNDDNQIYEWTAPTPVYKISIGPRPSLSGTLQVGQTVTGGAGGAENLPATEGGDADPSLLTSHWYICSSPTDSNSCVMGPAGNTLVIPASAEGKYLSYGVVWVNGVTSRSDDSPISMQVAAAPVPPAPPAPPATPLPLDLAALKLPKKVSVKKLVKAKGKFSVKQIQLACPVGGADCKIAMTFSAKVKKKSKKLGRGTLTIPAGTTKPLSGKLSNGGLKLLKANKTLTVTVDMRGSGGSIGKVIFKNLSLSK